jgi:hypothetical protein
MRNETVSQESAKGAEIGQDARGELLRLYIGKRFTGITVVPDDRWPGMWRVRNRDHLQHGQSGQGEGRGPLLGSPSRAWWWGDSSLGPSGNRR